MAQPRAERGVRVVRAPVEAPVAVKLGGQRRAREAKGRAERGEERVAMRREQRQPERDYELLLPVGLRRGRTW